MGTFTATAVAGSRFSSTYSVPSDIMDSGGAKSGSTLYSNEGSLGDVAGLSAATSPAQTAKHGYAGQLYDIVGLTLTAASATLAEGSTRQLGAFATLDDDTIVVPPTDQVGWSLVDGPLVSISASGLVTAGTVYRDTASVVAGVYAQQVGTLSLMVLDVNTDNYGSYAGDGLPDWWQAQYFGINNPTAAPDADPDGDGQSNIFEYIAGTVPTNAASRFSFAILPPVAGTAQSSVVFSPRLSDRAYSVEFAATIDSAAFGLLTSASVIDAGSVRTVIDTNATAASKFYRVKISLP